MLRLRLAAWSIALTALCGSGAHAAGTVAVLGIEPIGTSEATATALADALRTRMRDLRGVTVATAKDFMELKFLFNCMDPATIANCLAPAGKSIGVERVVVGTVSGRKTKHLQVVLTLIDSATGTAVRTLDEEVPTGDLLASDNVARWAQVLLAEHGAPGAGKPAEQVHAEPPRLEPPPVAAVEGATPLVDNRLVPAPAASTDHPGRSAKIVAGVALAVALAGSGIAIYTWRHYADLRDSAHSTLDLVRQGDPAYAQQNSDFFFKNPACSWPTNKAPRSSYAQPYLNQCNEGTSYASATTGLVVASGLLAAVAAVSLGIGVAQSHAADRDRRSAFSPRLRVVSPVVTYEGGGVSAVFEF